MRMLLVETYRVTNETIRFWACNTPCMINIAAQRQVQQRLLMSWTSNPRIPGRPHICQELPTLKPPM
jgi:hypothetical protein